MYQPSIDPLAPLTHRLLADRVFSERPVQVLDGGARFGTESVWDVYGDQADIVAFEPDRTECDRLNALPFSGGARRRYFPIGLAGSREPRTLHVAHYPDASSILPVDESVIGRFAMGEHLREVGTEEIETVDIRTFLEEHSLPPLDVVKLDIEGAELEALRGAEAVLRESVVCLSVEVWFQAERHGRPLFGEIDAYLRDLRFVLFDLREINRWSRVTPSAWAPPTGAGQLMYANAIYFKDVPAVLKRAGADPVADRRACLLLASVAERLCYPDFAFEVLRTSKEAGIIEAPLADALMACVLPAEPKVSSWRAPVMRLVRRLVPPRARRRIMRLLQQLVAE